MARLLRNAVVLAKIESVYGTTPTMNFADDGILCEFDWTQQEIISGEVLRRNFARGFIGAQTAVHEAYFAKLKFSIEAVGSGDADTPPVWGKLIRACGFTENIVTDTRVEYWPQSDVGSALESIAIMPYLGASRQIFNGCRGTFSVEFIANQIPKIHFEFWGRYTPPTDVTPAGPMDFSAWNYGVPCNSGYTGVNIFNNAWPTFQRIRYDINNRLLFVNRPGEHAVRISDRAISGEMEVLARTLSSANPFTLAKAGTMGYVHVNHGQTGYKVAMTADLATGQLLQPKYSEVNGEVHITQGFNLIPLNNGNNEIRLSTYAS